ncbi:MAG: hypothetical protein Q9209_000955 [Squamulea sp. 1 TL-2023]
MDMQDPIARRGFESEVRARVRSSSGARRLNEAQLGTTSETAQIPMYTEYPIADIEDEAEAIPSGSELSETDARAREGQVEGSSDTIQTSINEVHLTVEPSPTFVSAPAQTRTPVSVLLEFYLPEGAISSPSSGNDHALQHPSSSSAAQSTLPSAPRWAFRDGERADRTYRSVPDVESEVAEPRYETGNYVNTQAADLFPRPTLYLIIKRQKQDYRTSIAPLVVVRNGDERPDTTMLFAKIYDIYVTLQARGEPWSRVEAFPYQVEVSAENQQWMVAGLRTARDRDRASILKGCYPHIKYAETVMSIRRQTHTLRRARVPVRAFRSRRREARSDASEFEKEECEFEPKTYGHGKP